MSSDTYWYTAPDGEKYYYTDTDDGPMLARPGESEWFSYPAEWGGLGSLSHLSDVPEGRGSESASKDGSAEGTAAQGAGSPGDDGGPLKGGAADVGGNGSDFDELDVGGGDERDPDDEKKPADDGGGKAAERPGTATSGGSDFSSFGDGDDAAKGDTQHGSASGGPSPGNAALATSDDPSSSRPRSALSSRDSSSARGPKKSVSFRELEGATVGGEDAQESDDGESDDGDSPKQFTGPDGILRYITADAEGGLLMAEPGGSGWVPIPPQWIVLEQGLTRDELIEVYVESGHASEYPAAVFQAPDDQSYYVDSFDGDIIMALVGADEWVSLPDGWAAPLTIAAKHRLQVGSVLGKPRASANADGGDPAADAVASGAVSGDPVETGVDPVAKPDDQGDAAEAEPAAAGGGGPDEADVVDGEAREEADRTEEEKQEQKEDTDRAEKEKQDQEEDTDRAEKEKQEEEEDTDRTEKEMQEQEEAERAAKEKQEREEAERAAKEKQEQEEAERLEKEKQEREEAERAAKEKQEREEAERAAKEKQEREEAERLDKEKQEREAREEAERLENEKREREKREGAAARIQAVARGRATRRDQVARRGAAVRIQTAMRGKLARNEVARRRERAARQAPRSDWDVAPGSAPNTFVYTNRISGEVTESKPQELMSAEELLMARSWSLQAYAFDLTGVRFPPPHQRVSNYKAVLLSERPAPLNIASTMEPVFSNHGPVPWEPAMPAHGRDDPRGTPEGDDRYRQLHRMHTPFREIYDTSDGRAPASGRGSMSPSSGRAGPRAGGRRVSPAASPVLLPPINTYYTDAGGASRRSSMAATAAAGSRRGSRSAYAQGHTRRTMSPAGVRGERAHRSRPGSRSRSPRVSGGQRARSRTDHARPAALHLADRNGDLSSRGQSPRGAAYAEPVVNEATARELTPQRRTRHGSLPRTPQRPGGSKGARAQASPRHGTSYLGSTGGRSSTPQTPAGKGASPRQKGRGRGNKKNGKSTTATPSPEARTRAKLKRHERNYLAEFLPAESPTYLTPRKPGAPRRPGAKKKSSPRTGGAARRKTKQ